MGEREESNETKWEELSKVTRVNMGQGLYLLLINIVMPTSITRWTTIHKQH